MQIFNKPFVSITYGRVGVDLKGVDGGIFRFFIRADVFGLGLGTYIFFSCRTRFLFWLGRRLGGVCMEGGTCF